MFHCRPGPRGLIGILFLLAASAAPGLAQPLTFGSADDPREAIQRVWWRRESSLNVMGGPSLIGPQWRAAGSFGLNAVTKSLTGRFSGTVRAGIYGEYEPDVDELYDLLRLVEFARYNPPARTPLHLRAGPLERIRLGTGHLVNFFNSSVAYDERTIGVETMLVWPALEVSAFTDNVLLDGVTGGRVGLRPLHFTGRPRLSSLIVGFDYVTDLATREREVPTLAAYGIDLQFHLASWEDIFLTPFVSYGRYENYGSGLSFGADLESPVFLDLARFTLRVALYYNGRSFIPGYIGSFYQVNNALARICDSENFFAGEGRCQDFVGVPLENALGGNDLLTELRVLFFERFEFWYAFRRHYGTQALSEYHLRLFVRIPNRLRFDTGIDRGGLRGFFSLLSEMDDETALVFNTDYRIYGNLWAFIRARYSFERLGEAPDGTTRYIIQRRFEPLTGLRFTL